MATSNLSPLQQELLNRADTIFNSIGAAVGKASTLAAEQVPDIALQYVAYGRLYLTLIMSGAILVFLLSVVAVSIATYKNSKSREFLDYTIPVYFVSVITTMFSVTAFFHNLKETVMVWVAPKIWLMTEIVHLVK